MEVKKQLDQNLVKIVGSIIKVEPARKKGYYLVIQEVKTNLLQGVFSQWSYELETNGLFTLRQSGKYFLITNYQALNELNQIKLEENKVNSKLYQEQESQEQKHEAKQITQLETQLKQLEQEKQELINLVLNHNYIYSQLFSQQVQKIK